MIGSTQLYTRTSHVVAVTELRFHVQISFEYTICRKGIGQAIDTSYFVWLSDVVTVTSFCDGVE